MGFTEQIVFILAGFSVVLVALSGLWGISTLSGWVITALERKLNAPAPAASVAPAAPVAAAMVPVAADGIPPHHVAALTAAIAAMTGGKGRITQIYAPAHRVSAWSQSGRIEHFSSHRVRSDWAIPGPPHRDQSSQSSPSLSSTRTP